MFCHILNDCIWVAVTIELNLFQTWKSFDSRKEYHFYVCESPDYLLKLRSSFILKMNGGDVRALNSKIFEILELSMLEGQPHFCV